MFGIMRQDYYDEYYKEIDKFIWNYVRKIKNTAPEKLQIGDYRDVSLLIVNSLYSKYSFGYWKRTYTEFRRTGKSIESILNVFEKELDVLFYSEYQEKLIHSSEYKFDIKKSPFYEMLLPYKNQIVIYVFNLRQLVYLTPLIQGLQQPILLLSEFDIPEETDLPEYVTAMELEYMADYKFSNPFLEKIFPFMFHFLNTYDCLLEILNPKGIIVLEGCHLQEHVLGLICNQLKIPSFCIQQGWPSLMHTMFCNYSYKYFLTWGNWFNELWRLNSPIPNYKAIGYMYPCEKENIEIKKSICFFMQAPVLISDAEYFSSFIEIMMETVVLFPTEKFLVREHPEFRLSDQTKEKIDQITNLKIVTESDLSLVFEETKIVVAHFSSVLMEGLIHNCIPVVLDLTADSIYYPDIETAGLGFITKDKNSFINALSLIIHDNEKTNSIYKSIEKKRKKIAEAVSVQAVKNAVQYINSVIGK
jgi:hypothetical protein